MNTNALGRVLIASYPTIPGAQQQAEEMAAYLLDQGVDVLCCCSFADKESLSVIDRGHCDLLIALGGDGTMLRAGNLGAASGTPVLGINMGHFGFLTEVQQGDWLSVMPDLLAGNYRLEERTRLRAEHWRGGELKGTWHVLNEVVVCRGQFVRPIFLRASVSSRDHGRCSPVQNEYVLADYVADGLIVATATGSTAYALAVGGPIMPPDLSNILIVPVAPHLSVNRPLILAEGACVTIEVHTQHEAVMSADGHPPVALADGDVVHASTSEHRARFVRFHDEGFFYRNITAYLERNPASARYAQNGTTDQNSSPPHR